jgi:hypothetical protein
VRPGRDNATPAAASARADDDAECWEQAALLRAEHRGWIVIWLASESRFRAYRRLPGTRRDTTLSAATPAEMTAQIRKAEQAVARRVGDRS